MTIRRVRWDGIECYYCQTRIPIEDQQRQTAQDSALIIVFQPKLSLLTILDVILRIF